MRPTPRSFAPRSWLRLPRRTARTRLTLLYGGMFLFSGVVLLALVNLTAFRSTAVSVTPVPQIHFGGTLGGRTPGFLLRTPNPAALQQSADRGRLFVVSLLALALAAAASALFGWIAAGRVLRPLRTITTTTQRISLHPREQHGPQPPRAPRPRRP